MARRENAKARRENPKTRRENAKARTENATARRENATARTENGMKIFVFSDARSEIVFVNLSKSIIFLFRKEF